MQLRNSTPAEPGTKIDLAKPTDYLRPSLHAHTGNSDEPILKNLSIHRLTSHIDQAPSSAIKRTYMHLPDEADTLLKGRVRIIKYAASFTRHSSSSTNSISVWRPLKHPVQDWPLAFCDGSSIKLDDLIETDHLRRGYAGANMNLRYRKGQRWYYLSKQRREEIAIFKNFDSDSTVKAKCKDP